MQKIVCLFGLIALSYAQFQQQDYQNIPGVMPPPWQGPLSDHIHGIPPKDTPEVAAAKAALNQAYAQVLAVLPELPPEERYRVSPYVPTHVQPNVPVVPQHNHHHGYHNLGPHVQVNSGIDQFKVLAEEIPRSSIGEVPEVHAARVAHLKAYQEAAAGLPRIAESTTQRAYYHTQPVVPQYSQFGGQTQIQDTPEVARAKAEHAAAVAALG